MIVQRSSLGTYIRRCKAWQIATIYIHSNENFKFLTQLKQMAI